MPHSRPRTADLPHDAEVPVVAASTLSRHGLRVVGEDVPYAPPAEAPGARILRRDVERRIAGFAAARASAQADGAA